MFFALDSMSISEKVSAADSVGMTRFKPSSRRSRHVTAMPHAAYDLKSGEDASKNIDKLVWGSS